MISYYLTDEAAQLREQALIKRIVNEHCGKGPYTFDKHSDFHKLPPYLQKKVIEELHDD